MIGIPINPNSISIPMIQTGCCQSEFDSTYPIHLNGIINQDDFQKSIKKINHRISSNINLKILTVAVVLNVMSGFVLFVNGAIRNTNSNAYQYHLVVNIGVIMSVIGSIISCFGCYLTQLERVTQLREVIAEESLKYSSRSPIACSWRLGSSRTSFGLHGYYNNPFGYHVCIIYLNTQKQQQKNFFISL
ncbi:unnamed protein product [Rotaria sp. Silwood2]|nr:unnamed protein product [Rotaria sp. Silwood2]CAF4629976.1 unnamed protein product [Rotaria sp. Silwood2]